MRTDFLATLRFWSDRGVAGFRVNVAHGLAKDLAEPLRDIEDIRATARTNCPRTAAIRCGTAMRCTASSASGAR
ncbi:hypothetical protein GCM10009574_036580 [Streptomyces asiaticus]|uniref:Glycosyl hydrolase family 13 catalytic domain-containing protein n=2 Tax=Streptomyces rhizosphaericus TaxID=114699 RepID=A0ABP4C268_9ACTN